MPFKAFFDGPCNDYTNKYDFYRQGGSPKFLVEIKKLIEENKDEIEEINISWYLYNNKLLHDYLKAISNEGIKVNVVTIPLEGYDDSKPKNLIDLTTGKVTDSDKTKYSLAKEIFTEIYESEKYPNYSLYFFPHLYVRSEKVNHFSRGQLPYSLHLKTAYIKKKSGSIILLSSSNLAIRDIVKNESLLVIHDEEVYENTFNSFYKDLIKNSIKSQDYNEKYNTTWNSFEFLKDQNNEYSFITAPFYFDSANKLEESLVEQISMAKERIIICAQHLAAFDYKFNANYHSIKEGNEKRKGILGKIIDKTKAGVKLRCFSQTFVATPEIKNKFSGKDFRKPANPSNFSNFFKQLSKTENVKYYVNKNIHSKFVIIDNKLIFCTYNFTPTQFIYLDKVEIEKFKNNPDLSYKGIHCEVSAHVLIEDKSLVNSFIKELKNIVDHEDTCRVL